MSRGEPAFEFTKSGRDIQLVSQTWRGGDWRHDLVLCGPLEPSSGPVVLHVTGWEPNEADLSWADSLAETMSCPVANLFQIPNQPLWDLTEDALIAHTFDQYIESGEEDWPLLFPMVKSVVAAMDALEDLFGWDRFVLFGASKRGWTAWLSATLDDPRVVGIAPMVFDHLNMPVQLIKQKKDWGELSPMIVDYTRRDLDAKADTDRGQRLVSLIDPYVSIHKVKCPVLAINGANDPYWTVDATSQYWDKVADPKWLVTLPNYGHSFWPSEDWSGVLGAFTLFCSGRPAIETDDRQQWHALSDSRVFSEAEWSLTQPTGQGFHANFERRRFLVEGHSFWLNDPVTVSLKY